jgi:DNA-binding response OmpR family regulator
MRILVIEDEKKLAREIRENLEHADYDVCVAHTGEDGFFLVNAESFDLVILDLMLPGRSGIDILSALRKRDKETPVIVVTARDAVEDRVLGLDSGADDYLVKPFAFAELLARMRALSRRGSVELPLKLKYADLELDRVTRDVSRADRPIDLTAKEFELLEYLLRHQGSIVTREMIVREIWNEPARVVPLDNVIDVHMARLRKKVDNGSVVALVHTVRGVGFILREQA